MPFCELCTDLTALHHRIALDDLERGVTQGCRGCSLLGQALKQFSDVRKAATHLQWMTDRSMHISLITNEQQSSSTVEIFVEVGSPHFSTAIGPGRSVSEHVWTEGHRNLVLQWLRNCSNQHRICPPTEDRPLPTRVIDVSEGPESVHLRISQGVPGQYVALSHSWGGYKPIETTRATLRQHCDSISFGDSSKTFKDAAQVCRDLGYKYLWIDSLCIVQDDSEDWATEAGKMSQVYRNAALTISAEGAADAREGLFLQRMPSSQLQNQVELQSQAPSGHLGKIFIRTRAANTQRSCIVRSFVHASDSVSESRLASRAWILQERLLSPRILHFYREELAWSCCSVSRCECRLDGGRTDISVFKKLQTPSLPREELAQELQRHWTDLVVEFTHRKLTMIRDRLAAMSGLARVYHEITGSKYCAGLFFEDLAYGLLWISDHKFSAVPITRNNESPNQPSWSWASITGPVKYLDRQRSQFERRSRGNTVIPLLEVVGAHLEASSTNAFGDVYFGWVCVKGQLLRVTFDQNECVPWNNEVAALLQVRGLHRPPVVVPDHVSPGAFIDKNNVYLLRAAKFILGGMWSSCATENVCLMLERVSRPGYPKLPLFKRCGFVLNAFPSDVLWLEHCAPSVHIFLI
ncbi:heterokaryon incompatibility protein [Stagonosporopsis vannaccii]|nr:heterokaryon incompatibility protein [Stagonosporopsis vannaccii]